MINNISSFLSVLNLLNELKHAITSSPILIYSNFDETFLLTTNDSAFAIDAILSQGKDLSIGYASRTLFNAETKYSTIERDLLAIV